nr:hypothetical protein [Tanacetum cinerariifolium]
MVFLSAVAASRFPSTNNKLRTFFNKKNHATIQDDRVTVQQVQGRQCTQHEYCIVKDKKMLAKAHESGQILDEEQLAFLADLSIPYGQAVQTTILNNAAFLTEDLDAYDSDCDDVSNAKAVLMANLSNYGSDFITEVPHSESYHNDLDNQSVHAMQDFKHTPVVDFLDNKITSDSNIILYSQYLQETQQVAVQDTNLYAQQDSMILFVIEQMYEQMINHRLNINLSTRKKMIDSQMDDMIKEKLALKQQINSFEKNLSNQIKEKESLLQTFTVLKNKSNEKEGKYMDKEIDLEKKINALDNIVYKVGQSAQTVNMLTKPLVFYDDTHKQALGYQNSFYLKKAQRIKPTLYDGSVISSPHAVILVIDDKETVVLEEVNLKCLQNKTIQFQKKRTLILLQLTMSS